MSYRRTEAITVYQRPYSETSQIITFYTADCGKLVLLARGIQRQKKRNLNPPDLFSHSEIVWLEKAPQNLNILTEITIKDSFPSLRANLNRLQRAFYVAEFLNELTEPREPNRDLFNLTRDTLKQLAESDLPDKAGTEENDWQKNIIFFFEAQALKYLGYMPNTFSCIICGRPPDNRRVLFSLHNGSVMCAACRPARTTGVVQSGGHQASGLRSRPPALGRFGAPHLTRPAQPMTLGVSAGIMKLMSLLGNPSRDSIMSSGIHYKIPDRYPFLPDLQRLKITRPMQMELRRFINKYITFITGREFNSMKGRKCGV